MIKTTVAASDDNKFVEPTAPVDRGSIRIFGKSAGIEHANQIYV
jgi:hypothetical protein